MHMSSLWHAIGMSLQLISLFSMLLSSPGLLVPRMARRAKGGARQYMIKTLVKKGLHQFLPLPNHLDRID